MPVAYDFRAADVAAGGQGAPLVPVFHQALARDLARPHPIAVLNIGGVANVTFVDGGDPVACDTGPGNALIDDFMRARTGAPYDDDGDVAATGQVRRGIHRARARRIRSSTEAAEVARPQRLRLRQYRPAGFLRADGAATLSALTVEAVARVVPHLPAPPRAWIVAGGGARNPTLMRMLARAACAGERRDRRRCRLVGGRARGAGFRLSRGANLRGLPITFPTTTGAPKPMPGGLLAEP